MKASFKKHILKFIKPGGTSRGVLQEKESWILKIEENGITGYGEVSIIPGLSIDDVSAIETILINICREMNEGKADFSYRKNKFPAINFAIEQAFRDLKNGGNGFLFRNDFTDGKAGIKMNGLVWMNPVQVMKSDAVKKIESGFTCIKFKIGTYDFSDEYNLLKDIRNTFGKGIEIRVDANGAYNESNVFQVMNKLSELHIHSIEQPIKPGQFQLMRKICKECEIPVALDEELIGVGEEEMEHVLDEINPAFLILKPSLLGGWKNSDNWIKLATKRNIGWWATSALESNIGLSAIAQWVANYDLKMPQGLGTGNLYHNNFNSQLEVRGEELWMNKTIKREMPF